MIVKLFELKKKDLKKFRFFLLYGNNDGLMEETLEKTIKPIFTKNLYKYDESNILKSPENFEENIQNSSFFDSEKLIIISRATDKIFKILSKYTKDYNDDVTIILLSGILEKKSKIRNYFEKDKNSICIPFYEDNLQSLNFLAQNFFREKKIPISQQNINLITERCRGDRINLYNELSKIENYTMNGKKIDSVEILKLTNLSENYDITELVDSALAKNNKKTLNILNENNFAVEDSILILRIFLNKLKRLLKIQSEIELKKNIEQVIVNYKPPIFWKEKDIVKQQIKVLNLKQIKKLITKINNLELLVKKNPNSSLNILTNFILEHTTEVNSGI